MLKFIKSRVIHLAGRRRYRDVFSYGARMRSSSIKTIYFKGSRAYKGDLLVVLSNLAKLMLCVKSGSWQASRLSFVKGYRWTSRFRPYFVGKKQIAHSIQADPAFIQEVQLKVFKKCRVSLDPDRQRSLNMYACLVDLTFKKPNYSQAILLSINGADSFQHFIQDCFPLLSLVEDLDEVPLSAPLILLSPSENFLSFTSYLQSLGINRPVVFISNQNPIVVEELFVLDFKPFNALYNLPASIYLSLYEKLQRPISQKSDKVIIVEREENTRNFAEIELLKHKIDKWAHDHNLDLVILKPHQEDLSTIIRLFSTSKYVFAIHGGANYNIIWAPQDCTLVEFIPMCATNSLFHLALSFGQNYLPFALTHDFKDTVFHVSEAEIDSILCRLDYPQVKPKSLR